mgnify:CR=1 FL=1
MQQAIPFSRENFKDLFSKKFLLVIIISIPSAIIADFFNIPLAWMIGPMIAVSIAALNGLNIFMPRLALSSILIVLGATYWKLHRSKSFKSNGKLGLDNYYNVWLYYC